MKSFAKPLSVLLILAALILLGWLLLSMLPMGFSTDLSVIGTGEPAVVLVHDHNYVESVDLMDQLGQVRDRHPDAMHYLVADLNTPRGERFAEQYDVDAVTLVLFDRHGNTVARSAGRKSATEVEAWLSDHLPPF
ncbi:thioredoxin-like negative regulator of GroEL [Natronospira proteinivora]|uniref:Thioredoxin-like negative regulator of GroEL n=1 Tax=Natronospira proteinivora TaxID=1807133 RepID=A0ABT1G9Q6_9GAMM|nr:hypothetical protein [Natronospira proteinivora]MCP1728019.1 thioredoxin-like negative regulator of GroEL [Natronospira proteinivora]